ncbi:MAG: hypothetical protein RL523_481 [Actinomycetota bacterium]
MSNTSKSMSNCFGIGCAVILGLMALIGLSAVGASWLASLLLIGAIVLLAVRSNRRNTNQTVTAGPPSVATPAVSAPSLGRYNSETGQYEISNETQVAELPALPEAREFATSICIHSFSAEDLKGKQKVVCPCGYEFEVSLLRVYAKLRKQVVETQNKLDETWRALQSIKNAPRVSVPQAKPAQPRAAASAPAARAVIQPAPSTTAPAAKVVKPVKEVVKRNRVSLAPQQWLIIGASVLIAVAASIFVQVQVRNNSAPWFYLTVTIPLAFATGFMAFWGRKFSVMLANFMAAFSTAMQLASFLVLGTIVLNGTPLAFVWDQAPAWWWATDFLLVSIISLVLARFKANFGWKVISLVGFVTATMFFAFGPIREAADIASGSFGLFATVNVAAAVVLALLSKTVRKYQFEITKDNPDAAYEKDLAKRESAALERFTLVATGSLAVMGIGYTLYSFFLGGFAIEPVTFSLFAAVWLVAGGFQARWVDGLTSDKKLQERINNFEHIVGFTSTALALNAWVHSIGNLWLGVLGTAALAFVAVILGAKLKRVAAHPIAVLTAQYSLIASWLVWYIPDNTFAGDLLLALGALLVLFGFSLLLQQWFSYKAFNNITATISHALGLAILAFGIRTNGQFELSSLNYSLIALGLILALVLYSPVTALIAKRHEVTQNRQIHLGIAGLTGIFTLLITVPTAAVSPSEYVNLIAMLGVSAFLVGLLGQLLNSKIDGLDNWFRTYSFIFQGVLAAVLLASTKSLSDLLFVATTVLSLALANYILAWLAKDALRSYVAYGLAVLGTLLVLDPLRQGLAPWANLLVAIVLVGLVNLLQGFVAKRTEAKSMGYFNFASIFVVTIISIALNYDAWNESNQALIGLIELVAFALISAGLAERKFSDIMRQALRVNGLVNLVVAFVTFASIGDANTVNLQRMLVAAAFSVITLRQLAKVSVAESAAVTKGWFLLSYAGPVTVALLLNQYLIENFGETGFAAELYGLPIGIALAIPTLFNRGLTKPTKAITGWDIPVLVLLLLQLAKGLNTLNTSDTALTRISFALLAAAGFAYWRSVAEKQKVWVFVGYVSGGIGSLVAGHQLQTQLLPTLTGYPEFYSVPVAISLMVGSIFLLKRVELTETTRNLIRIDAPVLVVLLTSVSGINEGATLEPERASITLWLTAIFTYWRSVAEKRAPWVFVGYGSATLAALSTASLIQDRALNGVFYPELYTVLISLTMVIGSIFLAKQVELTRVRLQLVRVDIPVLVPVIVSIGYSITQGVDQMNSLTRLLLSFALFTGYSYWKLGQQKVLAWAIAGYLGSLGTLLTLVQLLVTAKLFNWDGPEIYTIAITIGIILGNLQLRRVVEFKTSLLSTGLPLAAGLLPSIIYSYSSIEKQFGELLPQEITRVVLILLISLVALVLGLRQGNLGATLAGGAGLALVVLPISWFRAGDSADLDVTVSLRSLVISALLFVLLALLRKAERVPDSSYIYLGIPVAVALVPSLFLTIQALGESELRQVDWWRFGIIVVVSLVLLIVGSLRELGGLFFPGLVGVFVGVLPYAFKPLASQSWFLWVILLVIAAIMVWIAVRLEQLRKMGKSSVSWVKALK